MSAEGPYPKRLLVEGEADKYAILGIMKAHLVWPDDPPWPVFIKGMGGNSELLKKDVFAFYFKTTAVQTFGVVVDADMNPKGKFQSICSCLADHCDGLPNEMPNEGLILRAKNGKRFGAWVMPDNSSQGAIESLLKMTIEPTGRPLLAYAESCSALAKKDYDAPFRDSDREKAEVFSWLAWQDPPSPTAHQSLRRGLMNPRSAPLVPFVNWFKNLYSL